MKTATSTTPSNRRQHPQYSNTTATNNQQSYKTSTSSSAFHRPSTNHILSSVKRFLAATLSSGFHQPQRQPQHHSNNNNKNCFQYSQNCSTHSSPNCYHSNPSEVDDVGLPLFKLCNFGVWKGSELGRGYSGVVHRGLGVLLNEEEDDVKDSRPMALKLSKPRTIHFNHEAFGTPGREFETLKLLYMKHVPVPRPLGFCVSSDDGGSGRTLLVMELVDGQTLREWINNQTKFMLKHGVSGRTLHPAKTLAAAIERLDIAIGLIEALQKLHEFGVFVDLKPRNIMIGHQKSLIDGIGEDVEYVGESNTNYNIRKTYTRFTYPVTLVDIGGVVLRRDVEKPMSTEKEQKLRRPSLKQPHQEVSETPSVSSSNKNDWTMSSIESQIKMATHEKTLLVKGNRENGGVIGIKDFPQEWTASIGAQDENILDLCCSSQQSNYDTPRMMSHRRNDQKNSQFHGVSIKNIPPADEILLKELAFHPITDRHLLETTCSYLSPELSAIIVESDRNRDTLVNHFHPSLNERLALYDAEMKAKVTAMIQRSTSDNIDDASSNTELSENVSSLGDVFMQRQLKSSMVEESGLRRIGKPTGSSYHNDDDDDDESDYSVSMDEKKGADSRNDLKKVVLNKNYEEVYERLKKESVIRERKGKRNDKEEFVELGQKSSVFSLGLIFVELFGGLRTGLTALCHFPFLTSWFSKEYAYNMIEAEYNDNRVRIPQQSNLRMKEKHSTLSTELMSESSYLKDQNNNRLEEDGEDEIDKNSIVNQSSMISKTYPSLRPFSGRSDRRIDCEFRIVLEWESRTIPLLTPSHPVTLFSLTTLRNLRFIRRNQFNSEQLDLDYEVKEAGERVINCSRLEKNQQERKKRMSVLQQEPTPSTAAPTSHTSSGDEKDKKHQVIMTPKQVEMKQQTKNDLRECNSVVIMKSFKELYKQYCYPFEGCFSSHGMYSYSERNDGKNRRTLELPIGRLTEQILDRCLELNPTKRPSYAILKRLLHGLKLILWNLKNEEILCQWKRSGYCSISDIEVEIDDWGYVYMKGFINERMNEKETIIKTISRKVECCGEEQNTKLILEIHFSNCIK